MVWKLLSQGSTTALQVITGILLARLLMPKDFGVVSMATMVTGLASVFRDLGLGQALIQRREVEETHLASAHWGTMAMGALLTAITFALAPLAGVFFHEPRMVPVLQAISFTFIITPFSTIPTAMLQRKLDFKLQFYAAVSGSLVYGAVGIPMALSGYSHWSLVYALLGSTLATTVTTCLLTRHLPPLVPCFRGIKDLWSFGMGVTLSGVFGYIAAQIDYFVVGRRMDSTALGLYTKAFQLTETPTNAFGRVLTPVLFPSLAALRDDPPRLRETYGRILGLVSFVGFPGMVVLAIVAPEAVPVVLGPRWNGIIVPLQIMTVVGLLKLLGPAAGAIIRATGHVYREMAQQMVRGALLGVGAWLVVPWGIQAVSWVLVVTTTISYALSAWIVYSVTGFGFRAWLRALAASFLGGGVVGAATVAARYLTLLHTDNQTIILVVSLAAALAAMAAVVFGSQLQTAREARSELRGLRDRVLGK
ncbi:MAG: lipopolysaccharide biosynthesis protein [Armatimonadia bacterium]